VSADYGRRRWPVDAGCYGGSIHYGGWPNSDCTRRRTLPQAYGRVEGSTRTLDSYACRLRHKLARDGDGFVVNVPSAPP
jgi:hypothetical protein